MILRNIGKRVITTASGLLEPNKNIELDANSDEAKKLLRLFVGEIEIIGVEKSAPTPQIEEVEAVEEVEEEPRVTSEMTKKELLKYVEDNELDIDTRGLSKTKLIEAINNV